jgi:hypothetical protein
MTKSIINLKKYSFAGFVTTPSLICGCGADRKKILAYSQIFIRTSECGNELNWAENTGINIVIARKQKDKAGSSFQSLRYAPSQAQAARNILTVEQNSHVKQTCS